MMATASRIRAGSIPAWAPARSGVKGSTAAFSASNPSASASTNALS